MSLQNFGPSTIRKRYVPGPTAERFHRDDSFVRYLNGCVGVGKTSTAIMEIFFRALKQRPFNGVRRTRFLVVRNTMPQLETTVLKSWYDWFPPQMLTWKGSIPITCKLIIGDIGDGTRVECEVLFYPLNNQDDVQKIRGMELTGAYLSEMSEMPQEILEMCAQRVGRFPRPEDGGASWYGVWAESNPPDDDSWIYNLFEVERPEAYKVFQYPPAIFFNEQTKQWEGHPEAENINNINGGYNYWLNQVPGKTREWIAVFLEGKYGALSGGLPVYRSSFDGAVHRLNTPVRADRDLPVVVGFDWGLNPAAAFTQLSRGGQLTVLSEISPQDCSLEEFMDGYVLPHITQRYAGCKFGGVGDPAGLGRNPLDKSTPFQTLGKYGFRVVPAFSNALQMRLDAVRYFLGRRTGFALNPECVILYKGFVSRYVFDRVKGSDGHYKSVPTKNEYSHVHDALQYAAMYYRHGAMKQKEVTRVNNRAAY